MGDPSSLLTAIYPAMMGITLIAVSVLGCRMRAYQRRLVGLEMRVGALESLPPLRSVVAAAPAPASAPAPVYQMPPHPQPTAPPALDPTPPNHIVLGMPTVAAVSQIQRYTGYI